eukprot:162268-Rhodomonas_salina.1
MKPVEAVRLWDNGVLLTTKWIGPEGDVKGMSSEEKEKVGKKYREQLDARLEKVPAQVSFIDDALKELLEEGGFLTFILEQCFGVVRTEEEEEFLKKVIWQ